MPLMRTVKSGVLLRFTLLFTASYGWPYTAWRRTAIFYRIIETRAKETLRQAK